MCSLPEAELVAGKGIVGDRYYAGTGEFSPAVPDPDHEVTLVDLEEVERFAAETGLALAPEDVRRNLVVRGLSLDDQVGARFRVGEVVLEGVRLCEPCRSLADRTWPEIVRGLAHRAGLRAGVVRGGRIRVGDRVEALAPPAAP